MDQPKIAVLNLHGNKLRHMKLMALGLVILMSPTLGCSWFMTRHEGDQLTEQIAALKHKMTKSQEVLNNEIRTIKSYIKQSTGNLTRNNADMDENMRQMLEKTAYLSGELYTTRNLLQNLSDEIVRIQDESQLSEQKIERLKQSNEELYASLVAVTKELKEKTQTPEHLYNQGKAALEQKQHQVARRHFSDIIKRWPKDRHTDDAMYLRGQSFYEEKQYRKAAAAFQQVFDENPKSSWADNALFMAGEAMQKFKWCVEARAYFTILTQKYPKTNFKRKANKYIKTLKKRAKNKTYCR